MGYKLIMVVLSCLLLDQNKAQAGVNKVELRRDLVQITQEILMEKDPLHHSYIFKSGVGNRETLQVNSLRRESEFTAGVGVKSWQSVKSRGYLYLLGRKPSSVNLLVFNGTALFSQHSLELVDKISSTLLFVRWNSVMKEQEVVAAIALDSFAPGILCFRVTKSTDLEQVFGSRMTRPAKITHMIAINRDGKSQLLIVDSGPKYTNTEIWNIHDSYGKSLDFRINQRFQLEGECTWVTVFNKGRKLYLVFLLPALHALAFFTATNYACSSTNCHFEHQDTLTFSGVSQVISFSVAQHVYLAVNGENAAVYRVSDAKDLVVELTCQEFFPEGVSQWLAVPVNTYRSDVVLFARNASVTKMFVWAGTNRGFTAARVPECDACLEGDWSEAVSLLYCNEPLIFLPRAPTSSSLVTLNATLHNVDNPMLDKISSVNRSIQELKETWERILSMMSTADEVLKNTINPFYNNVTVITGQWKIHKLSTPKLQLDAMSQLRVEEIMTCNVDVSKVSRLVEDVLAAGRRLTDDAFKRREQVWGLSHFHGNISFKANLYVDKLFTGALNDHNVETLLKKTFRKNKPQPIEGPVVMNFLQADNVEVKKVKNISSNTFMYNDDPVRINGSVTFTKPVVVERDVHLEAGGRVNGVDLLGEICGGAPCSVEPALETREDNFIDDNSIDSLTGFERVKGGRNLNVHKVNNVSWDILLEMVVLKNKQQFVNGSLTVKGKVSSDMPFVLPTTKKQFIPKQRGSENVVTVDEGKVLSGKSQPASADIKDRLMPILPNTDYIFTNLEVSGAVICAGSEWGLLAADVLHSDDNLDIVSWKSFSSNISTTNLDVDGSLGGVNISDLLTKSSDQVFQGPTVLQSDVILGNVTLTGLWNGVDVMKCSENYFNSLRVKEVKAQKIKILETLNGISIDNLLTTDDNQVTSVKNLYVQDLEVVADLTVSGKVCGKSISDFEMRRLSVKEDQNVTGKLLIDRAYVTNAFITKELNDEEIDNLMYKTNNNIVEILALHVKGNITTELGMNGYKLIDIHQDAVHLSNGNYIVGHLTFKDEVTIKKLDCLGFFNDAPCDGQFEDSNVVYRTNNTIVITGKVQFLNPVTVSEDLFIKEINGQNAEKILTTTSKQEITGNVIVAGDVRIKHESVLMGMLNTHNVTEFANVLSLTNDTIIFRGDVEFKEDVRVASFNTLGEVNGVKFDRFLDSLVGAANPGPIYGFKIFTGKTFVKNMKVNKINNYDWKNFLVDAVCQDTFEHVNSSIIFDGELFAEELAVDTSLTASSVHGVDLKHWHSNAIHLHENITLNRTIHLRSAISLGDVKVVQYGDVEMFVDLVELNREAVSLETLRFKSINVTENINVTNTVNEHVLLHLERNTLKDAGNQTVSSHFVMMRDLWVTGDLTTQGRVSGQHLQDIVTLSTNQTLNGNYRFDCMRAENISVSGLVTKLNMSEWKRSAVQKSADQEVVGSWSVVGQVELQGPVRGKGQLGDTNLTAQEQLITRHILDMHREMKANLSSSCEEVNKELVNARNQTIQLPYLELTQDIRVPSGVSFLCSFENVDNHYLSISERGCLTTFYKWEENRAVYAKLYKEKLGFNVEQLLALQQDQLTYLISLSSQINKDCHYTGGQVWLFSEHQLQHISSLELAENETLQVYNNTLFSMIQSNVYKWDISTTDQTFQKIQIGWNFNTAGKKFTGDEAGLRLNKVVTSDTDLSMGPRLKDNCTEEVVSSSVDPSQSLVAVLTREQAQVSRHWQLIKIYRVQGRLYDELSAHHPSHLSWLSVHQQTWFVFLQNQSSIELYQLQDVFKGFEHKMSVRLEAEGMSTVALPLTSRVNPQPYLLVHSKDSVRVLQAVLWGDTFPGPDLTCAFDQLLHFSPDTL